MGESAGAAPGGGEGPVRVERVKNRDGGAAMLWGFTFAEYGILLAAAGACRVLGLGLAPGAGALALLAALLRSTVRELPDRALANGAAYWFKGEGELILRAAEPDTEAEPYLLPSGAGADAGRAGRPRPPGGRAGAA